MKLLDQMCVLVQEKEEERKEKQLQTKLLKELSHEVKLLVSMTA